MQGYLGALLGILSVAISSYVAWYSASNIRRSNEATSKREDRKVDQEAFEQAARYWKEALQAAEDKIDKLESANDSLRIKNRKLEHELDGLRVMIVQMRRDLDAAGIKTEDNGAH